jgi:peroxiredoxin
MAVVPDLRRAVTLVVAFLGFAATATAGTVQVDTPAPQVDVRLLNGKLVKAKDLRGKVVVTMIWATWSPAARMALGEVQRLHAAHRSRGLEILALSIDESVAEVRDFWRTKGYSIPVAMRSDAFFERYGRVSTTPMYYVVDRHGILRHRIAGPIEADKLEGLLKPLLAEPSPPSESVARR